jgi:hypothetical protein
MRSLADKSRLEAFCASLGREVKGPGRIYLVGGASAILHGWRDTTIDIDLKALPEPSGLFESILNLKDSLDINVELASPDQFIPELPGWQDRSPFIVRHGHIDFHHYDFYSQALAKIERAHPRDLSDCRAMLRLGLIEAGRLQTFFDAIRPSLIRHPSIRPEVFEKNLADFLETAFNPP